MSTGPRITQEQGREMALAVKAIVEPLATVYLAGSLRREELIVSDIDLVLCVHDRKGPLIDRLQRPMLPFDIRNESLGPDTKQVKLTWKPMAPYGGVLGASVELYLCRPEALGWILMLRSGPAAFGKELVSIVQPWGFRFQDGRLCRVVEAGDLLTSRVEYVPVDTPNEATLFRVLGLPPIPLRDRTPEHLRSVAAARTVG